MAYKKAINRGGGGLIKKRLTKQRGKQLIKRSDSEEIKQL